MPLHKIDLETLSGQLTRPFVMERVAQVDHFAAYLYLCTGAVARHRHTTQDELFYVHSGMLSLDTDWGKAHLFPRECAVIPQGLGHASGSISRTIVLLLQAQGEPERKNGHGRLSAAEPRDALPTWSIAQESARHARPYLPRPLAQVDEMSLRLVWCQGDTLWHMHPDHDELLLVQEGSLDIGSDRGLYRVRKNELIVIPRGRIHRISSSERSLALSLIHGEVAPQVHMGLEE